MAQLQQVQCQHARVPIYRVPQFWVDTEEIRTMLHAMRYHKDVQRELSGWIARMMNMAFRAGQHGKARPAVDLAHLERMLSKMGYCQANATEIAVWVCSLLPSLHGKGKVRVDVR